MEVTFDMELVGCFLGGVFIGAVSIAAIFSIIEYKVKKLQKPLGIVHILSDGEGEYLFLELSTSLETLKAKKKAHFYISRK